MATSNRKAGVLLGKLIGVLLAACMLFLGIACGIMGGEPTFDDTYQSVIQRKYDKLKNAEGPKIVIIGGSNAGFGIDSVLMEEKTGYTVVNMGLHAGFGRLFPTELAKNHIGEGDIVLLAYEYGLSSDMFEKLGDIDLIMSGIDNNLEMYSAIPLKNMPEILGNLFSHAKNKAAKTATATGTYCSASFDALGNMILEREKFVIEDYEGKIKTYGYIGGASLIPQGDDLGYLNELREFVHARGAEVYFVSPVLLEDAYKGNERHLSDYAAELEQKTGIPFISDPYAYLFPSEYMFDTIYHCNDAGEEKRTELLIEDLRSYGILQ